MPNIVSSEAHKLVNPITKARLFEKLPQVQKSLAGKLILYNLIYVIMAKLRSLIKIEGTLDDLTFYKGEDGYLVRTKGGVSGDRIKTDPKFQRTRENGREFANSAKSGKLLRRAIRTLLKDAKDTRVTSRLTQSMSKVKNSDVTSSRGNRNVAVGILTADGKNQLKGFDFNNKSILENVLAIDYVLNTTTGALQLDDFIPMEDIGKPIGATHVSFRTMFLSLDFVTRQKDVQMSSTVNLPIDEVVADVVLTANTPTGPGSKFYLLAISFFQEVNGVQYPLNNGSFNALQILDVI